MHFNGTWNSIYISLLARNLIIVLMTDKKFTGKVIFAFFEPHVTPHVVILMYLKGSGSPLTTACHQFLNQRVHLFDQSAFRSFS